MKFMFTLISILISGSLNAQHSISGIVTDEGNQPQVGANVYMKGTYEGTTTAADGSFKILCPENIDAILVVSFIGYQTYEQEIDFESALKAITIVLVPETEALEEVVINVGSFEAGDKKRAVILNAIEVATTAGSEGDIYSALSSFPGSQQQGETGKIIVRGGESNETSTYIDGLLVSSPYYSSMPDLPARGRFMPFMFNGIMFSTGGYSAEYGQALSGVLELKTPGLFDENLTSLSLLNLGAGLSHTVRRPRSAFSAEGFYANMAPYFLMAQHNLDWEAYPETISGSFSHRLKTGKTGMIKTYGSYSNSHSSLHYPSGFNGNQLVSLSNSNLLLNTVYNTEINSKWLLKSGVAYNTNRDKTGVNALDMDETLSTLYARLGFVNYTTSSLTLKFGSELTSLKTDFGFKENDTALHITMGALDNLVTTYAEGDLKASERLAVRIGARGEFSSFTNKGNLAPRASLAFKLSKYSQVSFATGTYYQQPATGYLKYTNHLDFERAYHYIFNYQFQPLNRVFRTEIYLKKYENLITYRPGEFSEYEQLANLGYGYARGIDLFWRDNQTFRHTDYWISYSLIDSKRMYRDFPGLATLDFISRHNLTFAYKRWIDPIDTQLSFSYSLTSGRPYNNPNSEEFMSERTKVNHDLSGNLSYLTNIFGNFTVVHLSVSNLLGLNQIYSYRFSETPSESGIYESEPLSSATRRTIIIGLFISFK